jgi:hypothetical protein
MSDAERILVRCPGCGADIHPPVEASGSQVKCPGCAKSVDVPVSVEDEPASDLETGADSDRGAVPRVVLLGLKERLFRQQRRIRLAGLATIALGAALIAWAFLAPEVPWAKTVLRMGWLLGGVGLVMVVLGVFPSSRGESMLDAAPPPVRGPRASSVLSIEECDCTEIEAGDELFARQTVHKGDVVGVSRMASGRVKLVVVDPDTDPEYARLYRVSKAKVPGLFRLVLERAVKNRRRDANPFADLF